MDATTRQIIAFHVGDRSGQSAKALWEKIPTMYQKQATFYMDQYEVYKGVVPSAQHRAISKLARKTNHVRTLQLHVTTAGLPAGARHVVVLEEPRQSYRGHQVLHLRLQSH